MRMITIPATLVLSSLLVTTLHAQSQQTAAVTTVPRLVRVSNTFHPANGLAAAEVESVTFSVYKEETGGTPLWQETQNVSVDSEGRYNALLGATQNDGVPIDLFSSTEPRWLGVQFNRPAETEQPRVRLASVPYALKASDAETLGGRPASAYLLDPNATDSSAAGSSAGGTSAGGGSATSAAKPKSLKAHQENGATNYIAMFTDPTDVGNSVMFQNGNNIGISTTTPGAPLTFFDYPEGNRFQLYSGNGTTNRWGMGIENWTFVMYMDGGNPGVGRFSWRVTPAVGDASAGPEVVNLYTSGNLDLVNSTNGILRAFGSGNNYFAGRVGIGTTTPGSPLDVVGTINGHNPATTGISPGVQGSTNSPNGAGVFGTNNATTANGGAGVQGNSSIAGINGVAGYNMATTGNAIGVQGGTSSNQGAGVSGNASQAGAYGVDGFNSATTGYAVGVQGNASSPNGGAGVRGGTGSAAAVGVQGNNNATTGYAIGVNGFSASSNGVGVQGGVNGQNGIGVVGMNSYTGTMGHAVGTQGASASPNGTGLLGQSMQCDNMGCHLVNGTALELHASNNNGGMLINGFSDVQGNNAFGGHSVFSVDGEGSVTATSNDVVPAGQPAVAGLNGASSGLGVGVAGLAVSPGGTGLAGLSANCGSMNCTFSNGTAGEFFASNNNGGFLLRGYSGAQGSNAFGGTQVFGIDGQGNMTLAGNLTVTGNVSKGGGSFRIDHPLDPDNKYLYHSFVESPDMKNIYDGIVLLDEHGEATVTLPDWFEALNQDFRYQLTCVGGYAPVYVASEVSGNQFRVAGGKPGLKVSWQLTGVRHDAYANAHRIKVEVDKPANERGTTLTQLGAPSSAR